MTTHTSGPINSLADLHDAIRVLMRQVPEDINRSAIVFIDTLRLKLIEQTLTDGSRVYDLRLIED